VRFAALVLLLACFTAAAATRPAPLFSSYDLLTLKLEAPLSQLFESREEDGYSVPAALSYVGDDGRQIVYRGKASLRGHTSRRESECSFPKLKLHFASPPDDGAFAGLSAIKIGSHCDDLDGLTPRFGRLANERAPLREAFVYRLLDILKVPSFLARPARITYTDTSVNAQAGRRSITRNAMLLEDDGDAKKRFDADYEIDADAFTYAQDAFDEHDVARLTFAEALIGNFDWCLKMTADDAYRCDARRKLWNVTALRGTRSIPLIYDFDVSGMVAGEHRWFGQVFNDAFLPSRSRPAIEALSQVQRTRTLFGRAVLDATRKEFMDRRADIYRALDQSPLDEPGRQRIREYADGFFAAIGPDQAFYRPVVTRPDTAPYAGNDRAAQVCSIAGPIPVGTPVSEPLERRGDMIRVVLLDALWHWTGPNDCPEIRKGAVWIERGAVSNDFPVEGRSQFARRGSGATLTMTFPKFRPSSSPMSAAGAASRPSTISSR